MIWTNRQFAFWMAGNAVLGLLVGTGALVVTGMNHAQVQGLKEHPSPSTPGKPVALKDALEILKALEGRYRSIRYKMRQQRGFYDDPNDPKSFRPATPEEYILLECALDLEAGKHYFLVQEQCLNVRTKKHKHGMMFWAFDGAEHRTSNYAWGDWDVEVVSGPPGAKLAPNKEIYLGIIAEKKPPFGADAILRLDVPPFDGAHFADQHRTMSQCLELKSLHNELEGIEEIGPGLWRIRWRLSLPIDQKPQKAAKDESLVAIVETLYDVGRGGITLERRRYGQQNQIVDYREVVEVELFKEGFWTPRTRYIIFPLGRPNGWRREYTILSINEKINDATFRPEFRKGTLVTDYIRKHTYVVGEPFEEREAVRRFMQEQGLAAPPETARRWSWWWWVGGIGLLVILLGLLLAWRWRRRRGFGTSPANTP